MTRCTSNAFNPETLRIVNTFSTLADCPVPGPAILKKCLGLWSNSWLNNDMRQFLFLLRTNGLMLNNRLNAIDETVSPFCTFCRIIDRASAERDSFLHFFRNCPVTIRLLEDWCNLFEPALQINSPTFQALYWYGAYPEYEEEPSLVILMADTFKYVLWKFKKRRKIPNPAQFRCEVLYTI